MKRLMILVAMMAFVLLLPMNVEATGESVIEGDWVLDNPLAFSHEVFENTTVTGNLDIRELYSLTIRDCTLHVKGDLIIDYEEQQSSGGISVYNGKLIVDGDVILNNENGRIFIDYYSVFEVGGDVTTSMGIFISPYATFQVKGDYIQKEGLLHIDDNVIASFEGDLHTKTTVERESFITGFDISSTLTVKGDLIVENSSEVVFRYDSILTVEGDIIINTTSTHIEFQDIYLKGDFIANEALEYNIINVGSLNMVGEEMQVLDMPKGWKIANINFVNQNIKICNYLSGDLGSDITGITLENGILRTTTLDLNGYNMIIPGNMYAEGSVWAYNGNYENDPVMATFVVEGDYIQVASDLNISTGYENVYINGDMRMQCIDEEENSCVCHGELHLDNDNKLYIGGDMVIDTIANMHSGVLGIIYVAGDITQFSQNLFCPNYVVLNGTGPQSITLNKDNVRIRTLELTQERKYYTFNNEYCYDRLIQLEGIRNTAEGFRYYEDGNWASKAYKYVEYDGCTFLVANGMVATDVNGIAQDPLKPQDWYFLSGGQVQEQHTGLAEYDGQWFYVEKGMLDTAMNGCIEYGGELFMLAEGRIIGETSGLVQDPGTGYWYYLANGQAQTQYTGLAEYDGQWFYVVKGILAESFTGKIEYDGEYFNVVNGMVK